MFETCVWIQLGMCSLTITQRLQRSSILYTGIMLDSIQKLIGLGIPKHHISRMVVHSYYIILCHHIRTRSSRHSMGAGDQPNTDLGCAAFPTSLGLA